MTDTVSPRAAIQKFGAGQPVRRNEDPRLLRGEGRYTGDVSLPGQAHGYMLRSPMRTGSFAVSTSLPRAPSPVFSPFTRSMTSRTPTTNRFRAATSSRTTTARTMSRRRATRSPETR